MPKNEFKIKLSFVQHEVIFKLTLLLRLSVNFLLGLQKKNLLTAFHKIPTQILILPRFAPQDSLWKSSNEGQFYQQFFSLEPQPS